MFGYRIQNVKMFIPTDCLRLRYFSHNNPLSTSPSGSNGWVNVPMPALHSPFETFRDLPLLSLKHAIKVGIKHSISAMENVFQANK